MIENDQLIFHGENKITNSYFYFFMVLSLFCETKLILVTHYGKMTYTFFFLSATEE